MQTKTALSTMQAEYVALSSAMRDLLPFKALMTEIVSNMGLTIKKVSKIRTTVWEDNNGALTLAKLEPGRTTSRSKHFTIKYHSFREKLKPNNIEVEKIDTKNQIADILTKGLTKDLYEALRKMVNFVREGVSYMKTNGSEPIPNHSHLGISIPNLGVST